ncbi:hypothetical protein D9619_003484 [Psilocybe cf. subviscida]|uniref:Kinesin-like protein n=1 Tax=Psilocybe cf. subviscida TaxID=2480587 RepID=A0A8H5AXT0_9AGAR|nr:hypothetical protein D9619_003484 [Psilocybe cf. subviscida]
MSGTRASSRAKAAPAAQTTVPRTTRTRAAAVKNVAEVVPPAPVKKATARKPLVSKDNSIEPSAVAQVKPKAPAAKKTVKANNAVEATREPIMAYLRIRPRLGEDDESTSAPYLTPLSDTTVNMTDPQDPTNARNKYRFSTVPPSSLYTFSHVFPANTKQQDFFTKTTLPLVQDVLTGQNGLLFTYGVTNSGKTYTVQGGTGPGTAGILPRSLDVIFNSIDGLHGDGRYRPVRLHGVELSDEQDMQAPPTIPEPALADVLGFENDMDTDFDIDPTIIKLDRNYEYTIWISYAEVYNEKVYDLLASVTDEPSGAAVRSKPLLLTRQALPLRVSPSTDSTDSDVTGKYISGLRQFRVRTAAQAKAIIKLGQLHRRVFGTLANKESSRSHGLVIIKVVRGHRGEKNDPTSLQISRLTLVDLAGSERTKHTQTTGDRLKEAGSINKSLMVLGQCMEVMRSNQRKLAMSLSQEAARDGRVDTRDVKKVLAVVPFRHSKLTEALMDYFVGDGRTVMIVNVNPYDTGYDENSHVMKFASLAREVYVTPAPAPVHRVPAVGPGSSQGKKIKQLGPLTLKDPDIRPRPYTRKVTISMGGHESGRKQVDAILEVCEEDEPQEPSKDDEGDDDDDPINPLVDALFDEIEHLRYQLFESEMRCAMVEAETREEVIKEMEERMQHMEAVYARRLMRELEQSESKTDAKIDMLHQSGLFGSPVKGGRRPVVQESFSEEEEDIEMSLMDYGEEDENAGAEEDDDDDEHDRSMSLSPSPLASKKGKGPQIFSKAQPKRKSSVAPQPIIEKRAFVPDPPMLPSDTEDAELTETEMDDESSAGPSAATASALDDDENDEDEEDYVEEDDDSDGYATGNSGEEDGDDDVYDDPYDAKTPKGKRAAAAPSKGKPTPPATKAAAPPAKSRVSKLAEDLDGLAIAGKAQKKLASPQVQKGAPSSNRTGKTKALPKQPTIFDDDEEEEAPVVKKKQRKINKV